MLKNMNARRLTLTKDALDTWVVEKENMQITEALTTFFKRLNTKLLEESLKGGPVGADGKASDVLKQLLKDDTKLDAPLRELIKKAQAEAHVQSDIGVPKGLATG